MIRQIALFSELTRQKLEATLGGMDKTASRQFLQSYLDSTGNAVIEDALEGASAKTGIDDPTLREMVKQSMRYRVFAGILNIQITIPEEEPRGGVCGCQSYDEETNGWPCKVPGNQEAADNWHLSWGNSPACPWWTDPTPKQDKSPQSELEKMFSEGEDLLDIWRELGLVDPSDAGRYHH